MKRFALSMLLIALGCFAFGRSDDTNTKTGSLSPTISGRLDAATSMLKDIFAAPDKGIPSDLLSNAKCVIAIPGEKKGALIIGGNYGRGFATCRSANNSEAWSAPAPVFLGGGSWGAQIGGTSTDLLMLVMDDKGAQQLLDSKFRVGVDASAAAGPVGRTAAAGTDWKLNSEILTYSRSKGLFVGIDINGAEVKQDESTTKDLYGRVVPFNQILNGQVRTPAPAREFVAEVHRDFAEARASE
jgi:SH3 domain-containing YSC84-like protein 1